MSTLHVIVLAAGQGKRMKSRLPKVLHQVGGLPMLERVVLAARRVEATAVHVVYGHGGDQVRQALEHLDLGWVEQAQQLGTGHAVDQAMPGVPDGAHVLVLYGDVPLITEEALRAVLAPLEAGKVGLLTVVAADPTGYGRIVRDAKGQVQAIVEDNDASAEQRRIDEVNTGIIAAPASQLRTWLDALNNDNAQGEYYLTDVIEMAVSSGVPVEAVVAQTIEEVSGVNDRVQLAQLERFLQRAEARRLMLAGATLRDPERIDVRGEVSVGEDVVIDVNVVLEGRVVLGQGVTIDSNVVIKDAEIAAHSHILANCHIERASIGSRCRVGPFARLRPGTQLADDVHIGNFVEVKNTRMGPASKANHLTYLGDSDIGRSVNVGAGTITCNYDGANKHRTVIEDGAFIGSGVELVAPVTVHAGATIGAGSTISNDAPAGKLTLERSRQVCIERWTRPLKAPKCT